LFPPNDHPLPLRRGGIIPLLRRGRGGKKINFNLRKIPLIYYKNSLFFLDNGDMFANFEWSKIAKIFPVLN
jgi:hypothetical protein